jgi:hypothetical protein
MAGIDVVLATIASWLLPAGIAGRAGLFRRLVADGNRAGMLWCYILTGKDQDGKSMARRCRCSISNTGVFSGTRQHRGSRLSPALPGSASLFALALAAVGDMQNTAF